VAGGSDWGTGMKVTPFPTTTVDAKKDEAQLRVTREHPTHKTFHQSPLFQINGATG